MDWYHFPLPTPFPPLLSCCGHDFFFIFLYLKLVITFDRLVSKHPSTLVMCHTTCFCLPLHNLLGSHKVHDISHKGCPMPDQLNSSIQILKWGEEYCSHIDHQLTLSSMTPSCYLHKNGTLQTVWNMRTAIHYSFISRTSVTSGK